MTECPNVPSEILQPQNAWQDKVAYNKQANELAEMFVKNFDIYADQADEAVKSAAPKVI